MMDLLDRVTGPAADLLARVDDGLLAEGAPAGHPIWPLLRRAGALPGDAQLLTLRTALEDSAADVRWNAAVALARKGNGEGAAVLQQMLDRRYVEQTVKRDVRQDSDEDPVADVLISGLRAAATLKADSLKPAVTALSRADRSMRVRQAALEALKMMEQHG